jgi:hypothetical protein
MKIYALGVKSVNHLAHTFTNYIFFSKRVIYIGGMHIIYEPNFLC